MNHCAAAPIQRMRSSDCVMLVSEKWHHRSRNGEKALDQFERLVSLAGSRVAVITEAPEKEKAAVEWAVWTTKSTSLSITKQLTQSGSERARLFGVFELGRNRITCESPLDPHLFAP